MQTTVLADCPNCEKQQTALILDCDDCYEAFLDRHGDPNQYDGERDCPHLRCLVCDEHLGA